MNWLNMSRVYDFSGYYGFIYKITYDDDTYYIGKKSFYSVRKKNFGKKKLADIQDKRLKTYEMVKSESDWRTYDGSCKDVGNRTITGKYIIKVCETKIDLTYWETKILFEYDILFDSESLNKNIGGLYFSGKITGSKE